MTRAILFGCFLLPAIAAAQVQKPPAGSQINWSQPLSTGLVSLVPVTEGTGATFYDAVTEQTYPATTLAGTPANAQPPAWITPAVTTDYPWGGPAISNNGATAEAIQSTAQTQYINNTITGYSYAVLVEPLDTTTFGRICDGTGAAVITMYLNIPGRLDLVSTTWRNGSDIAINPTWAFAANKWILVLCTVQQGLGVMYVNGVAVASNTNVNLADSIAGQTGQLCYNTTGNGSLMCNANFSSWWVWNNRVLTAQEAAQMYADPWAMFRPSVTGSPVSETVITGATATFTASGAGNPAPTAQWQVSATGTAGPFSNIMGNGTATSNTLTLTNIGLAANGSAYRAVFSNLAGSGTTAAATLTVETPYAAWQKIWFTPSQLSNPAVSGDTASPAGDGIPNLMKYGLGLIPTVAYSGISVGVPVAGITTSGTNQYLSLTFTGTAADVTYSVQAGSNLTAWTALRSWPPGAPPGTITLSDTVPIALAPRRFIRLNVTGQ